MSTKEKLLALLERNREIYLSGEEIAKKLSLSRTAVWKAVKTLQKKGYSIDAITNKGYSLKDRTDILSAQGIAKYLNPEISDTEISVLSQTTSTNALVHEKANLGKQEGYLVIANEQTAGRGRLGRSFFSPKDTGIYMSLLLRPENYSAKEAVKITTMAAVAICEAIETVSEEKALIKWVNDIFVKEKKVCGILTEASFNLENGLLDYAILGIGINIYEPRNGFPKDISGSAKALFKDNQNDVKNKFVAEFLNRFYVYYKQKKQTDYVEKYRKRNFVIGRKVNVLFGNETKKATVTGIDEECRLLVKYPDQKQDSYSFGEIKIIA